MMVAKVLTMIDESDRYLGGLPGRSWRGLPKVIEQLRFPNMRRHSEAPVASDRIPRSEVAESNALMKKLGLQTRYHPDGRAYLIQG